MNDALGTAIRVVVDLLVRGEYDTLEQMTGGRRLTAAQLEKAIADYGRTLVAVPDSAWSSIDVVQVQDAEPTQFNVNVDLWTREEGRSDLTLELMLHDRYGGAYDVEILDLHTL